MAISAAVVNVGIMPHLRCITPTGILQQLKTLFGPSFTYEFGCNRRRSTPLSSYYIVIEDKTPDASYIRRTRSPERNVAVFDKKHPCTIHSSLSFSHIK